MVFKILLAGLLFCMWVRESLCADGTDAKNLRTQLFETDGYDKKVRPTNNQSKPIEVYVSLFLLNINELSESTETLKTTGFLEIVWTDEFLQWTPVDFGGLEYYKWPQGDIWRPDVALKNSFLEYKELGTAALNVNVLHTGLVFWYPFQVFQSTCSVNVQYYPFDVQECKLVFVAWSYSKQEVTMVSGEKGIDLNGFENNSEWDIVDTSYEVDWDSGEAAVVFHIKIKRKPLYVLLSVILPIIMLAVLNIFVFILPCESGEKASYAITVFLAFAVFLSIISSTFPQNSEVVAIFSIFLIMQTLQSTFISLIAIVLIRCSSIDDDVTPVPRWLEVILGILSCRPCFQCRHKNKIVDSNDDIKDTDQGEKINCSTDRMVEDSECDKEARYPSYSWKQAIKIMDLVFLTFFSLVLFTSIMMFFLATADFN